MNVSPYARGMMEFAFLPLLVQSQSSLLAVYLPLCWLKGLQLTQPLRKCWLLRSLRALQSHPREQGLVPLLDVPGCAENRTPPASPTVTFRKDTRSRDEHIKDLI